MIQTMHAPARPDRSTIGPRHRRIALLGLGMAAVALTGGCSNHAHHPETAEKQDRDQTNRDQGTRAIPQAEAAVSADGRNPALRLVLANAYLRAGRFESARQAFADAIDLGDDSSRAAIGLILSELALGHNSAALDTINTFGDVLPAADLGLALVLAGQNQRGIEILTNAIRQGQNQPKVRQNLAFAYAMAGMWGEAKIMAQQDVPANQVDARIQGWAAMARPEDGRQRVASLLGTPLVGDNGQPEALALAHFPAATPDQATTAVAQAAPAGEAPLATSVPGALPYTSGALARFELPPAAPAAPARAPVFVAHPAPAKPAPRQRVAAAPQSAKGTHLVQLGAFGSADAARRAWHHLAARNPHLQGHPDLVTKVSVNGRDFWRLQATGFAGQAQASSVCGALRAHGGACLVMAMGAAANVNGAHSADGQPATVRPASAHGAPAHGTNAAKR